MLRTSVKVKLIIFVLITLAGVSYVSATYVGLLRGIGASPCTVSAEFPDSGGIFTNAEVTYRGVSIGRVGGLHLIDNGVRVDLNIDNCASPRIPVASGASVSDRSVIGEQYVNLLPPSGDGPYMHGGEVIPMSRTTVPTATQQLLTNLDALVNSVDLNALHTTIYELGKAFNGQGPALGSLLDSSNQVLATAQDNLVPTTQLIDTAASVLDTQLAEAGSLQSFSHSLNLLSGQLRASDPVIRDLLQNGPNDLSVIRNFVLDNQTDLGATIAGLATVGQIMVTHIDGLEQILELYPALAAGGQTSVTKDGIGRLGFIANFNDPPDCGDPAKGQQGYEATNRRLPADLSPAVPNVAAHCTAPASSGTNVRGSANVPGGDPFSPSGGGVSYPRVTTANTVTLGTLDTRASILGDRSWIAILTTALN